MKSESTVLQVYGENKLMKAQLTAEVHSLIFFNFVIEFKTYHS